MKIYTVLHLHMSSKSAQLCLRTHINTWAGKITEKCEGGRFRNWRIQFCSQFEKGGIRVAECLRQAMPSYTKTWVSEFRCNLQLSMWCIGLNLKGTGQTLRDCARENWNTGKVLYVYIYLNGRCTHTLTHTLIPLPCNWKIKKCNAVQIFCWTFLKKLISFRSRD